MPGASSPAPPSAYEVLGPLPTSKTAMPLVPAPVQPPVLLQSQGLLQSNPKKIIDMEPPRVSRAVALKDQVPEKALVLDFAKHFSEVDGTYEI